MHEETGGLKNSRTPDAAWDKHRTRTKKCGDELEMQEETIQKILTMLDQKNLQETFEENDTALEIDKSLEFSQSFKEKMHAMVAERLGAEAADRFVVNTADMYEKTSEHESEKIERMSHTKSMGKSALKWFVRVAAVLAIVLVGFTVHKTNCVQATNLPAASAKPERSTEYSRVGSLGKIVSNLDYTNYPQKLEQIYVPSKIITGFQETERISKSVYLMIFYENAEGQWYQYQQTTVGANSLIDTEDRKCEEIQVGEWPGFYVYDGAHGNLWWLDYNYAYHIQGNLSKKELIELAESLVVEK